MDTPTSEVADDGASAPTLGQPADEWERKLEVIKHEVDALQITLMKSHTPWYRSIPTIISVLALLFSFGTTIVSYKRAEAQEIQAQRAELRSMLQRLASLPKENFDVIQRHALDPSVAGTLSGYINQENAILARQAAELARGLPPEKVSATEFFAIAMALHASYNLVDAREFLERAISNAKEFNDEVSAVRTYANLLFLNGQPDAGRVEYFKALNIFSKYDGYNDYVQNSTHVWTEMNWASSEMAIGNLREAQQHTAKAETYLSRLAPGPGTDRLRSQLEQAKQFYYTNPTSISSAIKPVQRGD